jgi:hypothetical protein
MSGSPSRWAPAPGRRRCATSDRSNPSPTLPTPPRTVAPIARLFTWPQQTATRPASRLHRLAPKLPSHTSSYTGRPASRRSTLDPKSSKDSRAPRRGSMPSSAAQLPGVVIGCRAPQALRPERGLRRPAGGRRRRGRRGCVRTPATPLVARSACWVRRAGVRPTGRADVRCPDDRCPGTVHSGCPDGHGARGSAAAASALSAPRLDPGMDRCGGAAHVWAQRVRRGRCVP